MSDNIITLFRPVKWSRSVDRRLTQKWGERPEFYKKIWRPYHLGLDYAGPTSGSIVPVYSAHSWIVRVGYDETGFGNFIEVKDSFQSFSTFYCHLSKITVRNWDKVNANQEIWLMGSTGKSSAVHLHFWLKMSRDTNAVKWRSDPTQYIKDWTTSTPAKGVETTQDEPMPINASTIWDLKWLIDDKLFSGDMNNLTAERILIVLGRVYNKLKPLLK